MKIGKIYKIITGQTDLTYIGSTFDSLSGRWTNHKNKYKEFKKNNKNKLSIHNLFDKYGVNNFKIILIKDYKVCDRKHLEAYEQLWINKLNCCNVNNSLRFLMLKAQKQNYNKIYREKNKQKIKERKQKGIICECGSKTGKDKISRHKKSKKHKQYLKDGIKIIKKYNQNKLIKITCECGVSVIKSGISYHKKSKKHKQYLKDGINS